MDPIFSNISITIFTAIISGFLGAWFQYWFQNRKVNKVRGIAIKALKIFQGYAKKKQTFDMYNPQNEMLAFCKTKCSIRKTKRIFLRVPSYTKL